MEVLSRFMWNPLLLPLSLVHAALKTGREKVTLAFPYRDTSSPDQNSPSLASRAITEIRQTPFLFFLGAYLVASVAYNLIFGTILLATLRIIALGVLLHNRYLILQNKNLTTLKDNNEKLEKTVKDLKEQTDQFQGAFKDLKQLIDPMGRVIKSSADNAKALESFKTLMEQLFEFVGENQSALSSAQEHLAQLKATSQKIEKDTNYLRIRGEQVDIAEKILCYFLGRLQVMLEHTKNEEVRSEITNTLSLIPSMPLLAKDNNTLPGTGIEEIPE